MKEIKSTTVRRRYALALALGALVLTPAVLATNAAAAVDSKGETGITISGNARIRGYWQEDYSAADTTMRKLEHRLRLAVDVKAAGGTSLHTRFHMANNSMDTWDASSNTLSVATDYLYFKVPVGAATVTTGRQVVNWGNRMKAWDARQDRLRVDYKINDEFKMWGIYQKDDESQVAGTASTNVADDEDKNTYLVGGLYKTADLTVGVQVAHADEEWGDNGQSLFGFATHKAGDLTTSFEADFGFGDLNEDASGDSKWAMFLGFDYAMGDTTLNLNGAYAANGWTSGAGGGHFDQVSILYNTSGGHGIGAARFGSMSNDGEFGISIGAEHKFSPKLSLGGKLAYLDGEAAADWDAVALQLNMAYKINGSTTYHIDGVYADGDNIFADDKIWGLSNRFEISF